MNYRSKLSLRLLVALVFAGVLAPAVYTHTHTQPAPSADIVVSKSGDEAVALGG